MTPSQSPSSSFPIAKKLGELLLDAGLVEPDQVKRALTESRQTGEPLGKILLRRGWVTEEQLGLVLGAQAGTDYVRIGERDFNRELLDLFPAGFLARYRVLPLAV